MKIPTIKHPLKTITKSKDPISVKESGGNSGPWAAAKEAAANPEITMSAQERAAKFGPWDAAKEAAANFESYISVKETAVFLSIPVNTCYKLFLSRTLPSYKFGKLRRAKISDIVSYMESHRVESLQGR